MKHINTSMFKKLEYLYIALDDQNPYQYADEDEPLVNACDAFNQAIVQHQAKFPDGLSVESWLAHRLLGLIEKRGLVDRPAEMMLPYARCEHYAHHEQPDAPAVGYLLDGEFGLCAVHLAEIQGPQTAETAETALDYVDTTAYEQYQVYEQYELRDEEATK